ISLRPGGATKWRLDSGGRFCRLGCELLIRPVLTTCRNEVNTRPSTTNWWPLSNFLPFFLGGSNHPNPQVEAFFLASRWRRSACASRAAFSGDATAFSAASFVLGLPFSVFGNLAPRSSRASLTCWVEPQFHPSRAAPIGTGGARASHSAAASLAPSAARAACSRHPSVSRA